jgi:hypothetical protein
VSNEEKTIQNKHELNRLFFALPGKGLLPATRMILFDFPRNVEGLAAYNFSREFDTDILFNPAKDPWYVDAIKEDFRKMVKV